ncbi:MAG: hypothetical protein GXO10_07220 [Crenarchaeota archaeon]|nr:hypothetical protein [Thermoproteota archaeon]
MVINLAQEILRRVETYLEKIDVTEPIEKAKKLLSRHVDVLFTYTLEEYCDTESLISVVKAATSLFQRTLLIVDTFTICKILNYIRRLVIRGGVTILVIDYGDVRDEIPEDQVIIETTGKELVRDVCKGIEISETIEEPVVLRVPVFSIMEIEEPELRNQPRSLGLFYRDWKISHAWVSSYLIARDFNKNLHDRIRELVISGNSSMRVVVDYQLHEIVRNMVPDYTVISPKTYTITSLKNIVNRESDIVISTSKKVTKLSTKGEYIEITYRCLKKYAQYIWKKTSRYVRPLLALMYSLLNTYRDIDVILCSKYIIPIVPSKGKYDVRFVTRVPVDIFDTVDIVLEDCADSLNIIEEKIPQNFIIVYIADSNVLIKNLKHIGRLKRTKIILLVDNEEELLNIVNILKIFNIRFIILEIQNSIVDNVRKILTTDMKVIIILRNIRKNIRIVEELCDRCRNCTKLYCDSISLNEDKILINHDTCNRCHACVIVCTRGAIQLSEVSHNQLQTQHVEDPVQQD